MDFGAKISMLRRQRNMTQKHLADALGVSLRTITNYETGGRYPKQREMYRRIADILNVDINYLLTEDESFIVYTQEQIGSQGMEDAHRILTELRGLFAGGELAQEDKDEMMRAIQDAYWIAKERQEEEYNRRRGED